jgi:hypothetical protein
LQVWCQALGVVYQGRKNSTEMRGEILEAIERLQAASRRNFADARALLTWLGQQSLEALENSLRQLPFKRARAKEPFMTLEDWCLTVGVAFKGRQKQLLETEFLAAMHQRQIAEKTPFTDEGTLLFWLQTAPIDIVQEKLQTLPHYRNRQRWDFMSVEDWCQAVNVTVRGTSICELRSAILQEVLQRRADKKEDFTDDAALRNWWEKESLDVLREKLRSIPESRRQRRRHLMCVEDWCRVLHVEVSKGVTTKENMEENAWKALLAYRLRRHEEWRAGELEDLEALNVHQCRALLSSA